MAALGRILSYTGHLSEMSAFYAECFGFRTVIRPGDRIAELYVTDGGAGYCCIQPQPAKNGAEANEAGC